jgi:hypothetical protein
MKSWSAATPRALFARGRVTKESVPVAVASADVAWPTSLGATFAEAG